MPKQYSYLGLPSENHFRLLELQSSVDYEARIESKLTIYPVIAAPEYECLSYTWGNEDATKTLIVGDSILLIRPNLESALRRLRLRDEPRIVWVDAICINQLDISERSSQVNIMRDIYSGGSQTVVWLGEEIESDGWMPRAFAFIPLLDIFMRDPIAAIDDPQDFKSNVEAIVQMGRHSWWRRIWIIQEVVVAKKVVFFAGSHYLLWDVLDHFFHTLAICGQTTLHRFDDMAIKLAFEDIIVLTRSRVTPLRRMRRNWENKYPAGLVDIMRERSSTAYGSADPRDQIYALLGVLTAPSDYIIRPDYGISTRDLYVSVFKNWLLDDGDLRQLAWISHIKNLEDIEDGFPSWVPDFRNSRMSHISSWKLRSKDSLDSDRVLYAASGKSSPTPVTPSVFKENDQILHLTGIVVDTITLVGGKGIVRRQNSIEDLARKWLKSSGVQDVYTPYVSGEETAIHAFWRLFQRDTNVFLLRSGIGQRFIRRLTEHERGNYDWTILEEEFKRTEYIYPTSSLLTTAKGYIGLAYHSVEAKDVVCVLLGGEVPYVLRPVGDGYYKLLGECYLHGIMDGEIMKETEAGMYKPESIRIM